MKLTGARILMECLREQKVDTIFGYPGGTILNVYDALYDCKEITHILTSHEQGAAHAADGYARSTGKVGVCFATSGPGATNLTTGIATAYMDSSSVVFISCNVPQNLIGRDAFQEVDITGITMPITKSTYLVRDVTKLADTVREAFALARSGRPGPVVIDITRDVTSAECDYEPLPLEQHAASGHLASLIRRAYTSSLKMPEADLDDVEKLVEMIAESKKPMLICGGGVVRSRAHEEFRQFVRRIDAPVAITVMGGGGVSGRDVMTTGMIGMHGSVASNMACDNCDLLIAVGCRFSDRVALKPETFAHQAKIVHIDIDRAEINKNVQTDHHIIGDAKQVLNLLLERLPQYEHKEWKDFVLSFPRETEYGESESVLTPKQVLSAIARKCPQDSIVATDVGHPAPAFRLSRPTPDLRRLRHHGLRPGGRHRRQAGEPGQNGDPHHRRRLLPHERQRAGYRGLLRAAGHHRDLQQPESGHGPAVAEPDLRPPVFPDVSGKPQPGLREVRGRLRSEGPPGHPAQRAGGGHHGGAGGKRSGPGLRHRLRHQR